MLIISVNCYIHVLILWYAWTFFSVVVISTLLIPPSNWQYTCSFMYLSNSYHFIGETEINIITLQHFLVPIGGKTSIIDLVAPQYRCLGHLLLDDKSGSEVQAITMANNGDPIGAMSAIFTKWLSKDTERSWKKLIECMKRCDLNHFAREMEAALGLAVQGSFHPCVSLSHIKNIIINGKCNSICVFKVVIICLYNYLIMVFLCMKCSFCQLKCWSLQLCVWTVCTYMQRVYFISLECIYSYMKYS